ncbi:MAG: ribose-phosphate pyrophosphokinase [Candidatus Theseobacter exili]|nr:ribose-phosphate pyrophosphokinase [Candidatus Theseobacter exili]
MMKHEMMVFSGTGNPDIASKIVEYLGVKLGEIEISRFSDGELFVKLLQDVRGRDVFLIQSTCPPVNENLMELLIIIDALRRASAARITAVIPYFGYARQDRKDQPRVPISAKLVANLITAAGADRVLTMDLHADQIQGFFDIPLDNLQMVPVFTDALKRLKLDNITVVAPDVGGIKRARLFAQRLNANLAIVDKRRYKKDKAEVVHLIGEVEGTNVVIVDDLIATAGSLTEAANMVAANGANDIYAASAHPVLSPPALERIENSSLKCVFISDSIPVKEKQGNGKLRVISVASLFGEAIRRIHENESVSSLFD